MKTFLLFYAIIQALIAYFSIALIIQLTLQVIYYVTKVNAVISLYGIYWKVIILSVLIGIYNYMTCINF